MATVYKVEIETTSAWCNYPPLYVEKILKDFFNEYRDKNTGLRFENTKIEAIRK